jgi:RNA polymerase sigma-70 factor (ECF subfamily)
LAETTPPTELCDEDLMSRVKNGDQVSFAILMRRHARVVLAVGRRVLHDQGAAEELVQDVFFLVYKRRQLFDAQRGSVRAWLVQIAYNEAYRSRQRLSLRHIYENQTVDHCLDAMQVTPSAEYQAEVAQSESLLRQAFRNLSNKQKQTMELFFFEGYTLREISEELGESLGNVRHHYYRGLRELKDIIEANHLRTSSRHDS